MRKVRFYKYKRKEGNTHYDKVLDGEGAFHEFGVGYEEFESGPGNYSTAIIELENGTIKNIDVEMVEFIKEELPRKD